MLRASLVAILVLLAGCGYQSISNGSLPDNTSSVATIGVLPTTTELNVGFSKQLIATAFDSSNTQLGFVNYTWASSDTNVVTVDTNGVITGQGQGTATVTAMANGVTSNSASVNVVPASDLHPLVISPYALPPATAGMSYSTIVTGTGGSPPYTWSGTVVAPDNSSNGLNLARYDGTLSGTPTFGGLLPIVLRFTDSYGFAGYISTEIDITPGVATLAITNSPPGGVQGTSYNFQFTTSWSNQTGCQPNLRYHGGAIPPGLVLDLYNGTITGTPLVAGEFTFSVSAGTGSACEPTVANRYTDIDTYTINIATGTGSAPTGTSNWQRQSATPVLAPSSSGWDDFSLTSPSVIKVGGTYMMYYGGEDSATHLREIGLATSTDGLNWTRNPGPVITPGAAGEFDSAEIFYPSVAYDGTTYYMWYLGANQTCNSIGMATSTDGISWTKHTGPLNLGDCTTGGKNYAPGPVIESNGTFTMWYWLPSGAAIGAATSTDGINWTDNGPVNFSSPFSPYISIDRPSVVYDGTSYRMWFGMTFPVSSNGAATFYSTRMGFASSTDGVNWTPYNSTSGGTYPVFARGGAGAWDRPGVGQPWVILDNGIYRMWYSGGRVNSLVAGSFAYVEGSIGYAVIP